MTTTSDSRIESRRESAGTSVRWRRAFTWLWRLVVLVIVALLLWRVVIPQFEVAWRDAPALPGSSIPLIAGAVALELASLACYGMLTRSVLPVDSRPGVWTVMRVNLAGVATANALPGGGAIATGVRLSLLGGTRRAYAGAAGGLAMELPISGLLLSLIFAAGTLLCLPAFPGGVWQAVAVVVAAGTFLFLVALAFALWRQKRSIRVLAALVAWLPARPRRAAIVFVRKMVGSMSAFASAPGRVLTAAGWAAGNWLLDAAALGAFLTIAGFPPSIPELLLAHGLAGTLAILPISPGGLGVIEGALVPTILHFGASPSAAILGVTGWRLAQYWLPILLGTIAGLSLLAHRRSTPAVRRSVS